MASFKESSTSSRPFHSTTPHTRHSNGRLHSHSISLGVINTNHRVTRRKSIASNTANSAAAAAAAATVLGEATGNPPTSYHRRGLSSRKAGLESTSIGSSSGFGSYIAQRKHSPNSTNQSSDETPAGRPISTKHRSRRASEGSHLIKGEGGKRSLTELKCDRCGKGYKHSSCLTKHMWEHDPAWAYTSKLLISKHQQVQLLEAATVLVGMNPESDSDAAPAGGSDRSSASPTASGISEIRDGVSSTETTPPPTGEDGYKTGASRRFSVNRSSAAFSRSFQSAHSSSFAGSAPSYSPVQSHFRQSSVDTRPSTANTGVLDDDEAGLAAAIGLCNFGTPRSRPTIMSPDIPPVPPLPARYMSQSVNNVNHMPTIAQNTAHSFDVRTNATGATDSSLPTIFSPFIANPSLSYKVSDERDVKMDDAPGRKGSVATGDDDFDRPSVVPMDEDDDGVFGKMEE